MTRKSTSLELNLKQLLDQEIEAHTKTKIKLKARERELHTITQSVSYKLAKKIALVKHMLRVVIDYTKALSPKRRLLMSKNRRYIQRIYTSKEFNSDFLLPPTSTTAVILHLYYPDLLEYFEKKLKLLDKINYDLFITIPDTKKESIVEIRKVFPNARIAVVPNCGRDVLPFVEVMRKIDHLGYVKFLKLHSKKSPHRIDGDVWRDLIVGDLIPEDQKVVNSILKTLDNPSTALIGPVNEYVSLLVNYGSTAHHIKRIVSREFGKKEARELESISDEYGFFAGTMFWARVDAITPLIKSIKMTDFEPELGQEDSTLAHALERLLCVRAELYNLDIYGVSSSGVIMLNYHTINIPVWSEIALNP
jgi:lipopolysaccharide biosynthesis protein